MQNILSFSTLDKGIKVLLTNDKKIIKFEKLEEENKHSEFLIKIIENILNENSMTYEDIDIFSTIIGPGNFTNIKVAVSVLKTIQFLTNKKIITCNLFEIIKNSCKNNEMVILKNGLKYYSFSEGKNDVEEVILDKTYKKIVTNDNKINNARIYEFNIEDWIDVIYKKIESNDFTEEIKPLYIQPPQITKRKT